jgi:hypothetical protein
LGQFRNLQGGVDCLRATHVTSIMRMACRLAYPNPAHYMGIHESRIVAHSNRVTAACCLKAGGATDEEIAFRLRWQPGSVPTYLRECFHGIGKIMSLAIQGAMLST